MCSELLVVQSIEERMWFRVSLGSSRLVPPKGPSTLNPLTTKRPAVY